MEATLMPQRIGERQEMLLLGALCLELWLYGIAASWSPPIRSQYYEGTRPIILLHSGVSGTTPVRCHVWCGLWFLPAAGWHQHDIPVLWSEWSEWSESNIYATVSLPQLSSVPRKLFTASLKSISRWSLENISISIILGPNQLHLKPNPWI